MALACQPSERRTPVAFKLGQIRISVNAEALLQMHGITAMTLLTRHQAGDFGTLSPADRIANLRALLKGGRVGSSYAIGGQRVCVMTDPGPRRCTTLCLAEERPG
jgi:hypothetical protein